MARTRRPLQPDDQLWEQRRALDEPLASLGLDTRIVNALEQSYGAIYTHQLVALTREQILAISGFGETSTRRIEVALAKRGLSLMGGS